MKKPKYYYCRHCRQKYRSVVMADICFDLDMKTLKKESDEKLGEKNTIGKKYRGN